MPDPSEISQKISENVDEINEVFERAARTQVKLVSVVDKMISSLDQFDKPIQKPTSKSAEPFSIEEFDELFVNFEIAEKTIAPGKTRTLVEKPEKVKKLMSKSHFGSSTILHMTRNPSSLSLESGPELTVKMIQEDLLNLRKLLEKVKNEPLVLPDFKSNHRFAQEMANFNEDVERITKQLEDKIKENPEKELVPESVEKVGLELQKFAQVNH